MERHTTREIKVWNSCTASIMVKKKQHWLEKYLVDFYNNHRAQQRATSSSIQRYNAWVSIIALQLKSEKHKWALHVNELENKYGTWTWNFLRVHNGFISEWLPGDPLFWRIQVSFSAKLLLNIVNAWVYVNFHSEFRPLHLLLIYSKYPVM